MTNHWIDIKNSDCIMIIGSNAAENHPVSFKWVTKAIEDNGATLISVDPRFTRTSSKAHIYAPMRSGTDIAFIGGIIRHAMANDLVNEQYVRYYTNALYNVNGSFEGPADTGDGTFSAKATWGYDNAVNPTQDDPDSTTLAAAMADDTTVYGQLWKHFNRYTTALVSEITGCPEDVFLQVADAYCATSAPDKTGTIMYAMGTTQHTHGTQNIRSYVILQLLMGNMGLAGGGINALRGESNVQGSTDHCLLFHIIPGYLKTPRASNTNLGLNKVEGNDLVTSAGSATVTSATAQFQTNGVASGDILVITESPNLNFTTTVDTVDSETQLTLSDDVPSTGTGLTFKIGDPSASESYLWKWTPMTIEAGGTAGISLNWWQYTPKYMVSLLRAFWPTVDADVSYHYLPKIDDATNYSHISLFQAMGTIADGGLDLIKGLLVMGQNPAVGGPNAVKERAALKNLDWMVAVDLWETETASFWKAPGEDPATIATEVFLLPAASSVEKEGSITNSGRWAQWRYKAVDPPGDAKDDLWIMNKLALKLKELYAGATDVEEGIGIVELNWDYGEDEPDVHKVAKEINGYYLADVSGDGKVAGDQVDSFTKLRTDGATCSGNWLYCNSYVGKYGDAPDRTGTTNRMARRVNVDNAASGIGLFSNFSWCWPVNRRIIYNCASVHPTTYQPWDNEDRVLVYSAGWVQDGTTDVKDGVGAPDGKGPFIMKPEGVARLFGYGLADGPFPEHYEPLESPVDNALSSQNKTPYYYDYGDWNDVGTPATYPIVATTYRLTEHWQAGAMTRNLPWLCEMMPHVFVEMSKELAAEKGIVNGEKVLITTARGSMEAYAMVTDRFKPFTLGATTVHQVGIPWHWGYGGLATGDSANLLTPHVGDCNTRIPEYKAFLCDIGKIGA